MKNRVSIISLVALNIVLLVCVAAQSKSEAQPGIQSIVRARAIELVDDKGRIRASLNVATNGEAVFRLRDSDETIRLKLGASKEGSALLLLDDSTNPGLHVISKHGTTMTLFNSDGRKRVVEP
jgi:hypothetical protein